MKIYVASSWRNAHQPKVVARLRDAGHQVYDFRNPAEGIGGFSWSEVDPDWREWSPTQFRRAIEDRIAVEGFRLDQSALEWADACVMVQPCGVSSALEAGWSAGKGRATCVLLAPLQEPKLMLKLLGPLFTTMEEVLEWARTIDAVPWLPRRIE